MLDDIQIPKRFRKLFFYLYNTIIIIRTPRQNGYKTTITHGRIVTTKDKVRLLEMLNGKTTVAPESKYIQEGNIIEFYHPTYDVYRPTTIRIKRPEEYDTVNELTATEFTNEDKLFLSQAIVNTNRDYASKNSMLKELAPFIVIFLTCIGIAIIFFVYMKNVGEMISPMNALASTTKETASIISQWIQTQGTNATTIPPEVMNTTIRW